MKKDITDAIRLRLNKILRLSESGIDGEKETAKNLLENLLKSYNLTLEDIAELEKEDEHVFKGIRTKEDVKLFAQIVFAVKDVPSIKITKSRIGISIICTQSQSLEITDLYKWHKRNYNKEFKKVKSEFFEAYAIKHKLYNKTQTDDQINNRPPVDMERLRRIISYSDSMSETYLKSLNK